ncbi:16S rRNA (adenine1518-N6/adenine1519-N6)-dimethyltransferase [Streptomyces hygroscopicus]|nr:16S rRNA (adenine1518-N6/adenine1519-N6)-dimethyltransferase [Streptomyces hygroscopicus]
MLTSSVTLNCAPGGPPARAFAIRARNSPGRAFPFTEAVEADGPAGGFGVAELDVGDN